ncbi:unnamed protein product [Gemmata massiliana]|uniref:Uncharacterized protein n=1 Tax=Gemmata massiliana TaxID=1210884 RepID=A0A6P2DBI1_9BACT|nr:unnamed protein product [Gemmata massiliana]
MMLLAEHRCGAPVVLGHVLAVYREHGGTCPEARIVS